MNDKRHNRCEVCGSPTPQDWDGVPAKRCRLHRILPDDKGEMKAGAKVDAPKSAFGAMAATVGIMADVLAGCDATGKRRHEESTLSLHDVAYYPGKEYDDAGTSLGWVGYGHDPDVDRSFGPPPEI